MSSKNRKAIPLKETLAQPTSFDVEKLEDILRNLVDQTKSASEHYRVAHLDLEEKMYRYQNLMDTLSEVADGLETVLDLMSED